MATQSLAYDAPTYRVVQYMQSDLGTGGVAGDARQGKFLAQTGAIIKSATVWLSKMGTGADATTEASLTVIKIVGGTGTTAIYTNTFGSSGGASTCGTCSAFALSSVANTTLGAGDMLYCLRGTDATLRGNITYEYVITPGASITL